MYNSEMTMLLVQALKQKKHWRLTTIPSLFWLASRFAKFISHVNVKVSIRNQIRIKIQLSYCFLTQHTVVSSWNRTVPEFRIHHNNSNKIILVLKQVTSLGLNSQGQCFCFRLSQKFKLHLTKICDKSKCPSFNFTVHMNKQPKQVIAKLFYSSNRLIQYIKSIAIDEDFQWFIISS